MTCARNLILSAMAMLLAAPAAAAPGEGGGPASLLSIEQDAPQPPSQLAPLASDSAWTPRFVAAARELTAALRSGDEAQWVPLMGGRWLTEADRARIRALLQNREGVFHRALHVDPVPSPMLLGWRAPKPLSAQERVAIETGENAEAFACWPAVPEAEVSWPLTAVDADNRPGRPYACARIAYSLRGTQPGWRAFIE